MMGRALTTLLAATVMLLVALPAAAHHPLPADQRFVDDPPWRVAPADGHDLETAIEPWNRLSNRAGRGDVFVLDAGDPHVTVVREPPGGSWIWPPRGANQTCRIHLAEGATLAVLQHELGHCLGLADHVPVGFDSYDAAGSTWQIPPWVARCGPGGHFYRGIMSYCTHWWQPDRFFGWNDRWAVYNLLVAREQGR
jgi:hypothetical protein